MVTRLRPSNSMALAMFAAIVSESITTTAAVATVMAEPKSTDLA